MKTRGPLTLLAMLAVAVLVLGACGGSSSGSSSGSGGSSSKLALVAYSTPKAAYAAVTKAFEATPQGKGVSFTQSFGASGSQSRAVLAGLHADYVAFSQEPDITRLVKAGKIAPNWNQNPYHGMVTDSIVVIVVRKGNPKHINGWSDLIKPGVNVVTPNPFSSGSAQWNIMAAYGQVLQAGGTEAQAADYLRSLFKNVTVQPQSGSQALQTFVSGQGDALLSYENEAIFAQQKNQPIDYIVPNNTLLIENPVAVTTSAAPAAKQFLEFVYTKQAQELFAKNGYRPIVPGVSSPYKFPTPPGLFTIQKFGGWSTVTKKYFDPTNSIVADIERGAGVKVG